MSGATSPPMSLDWGTSRELPDFVVPYTYKCELCKEMLLRPMQTQCGHRLCGGCLERHFNEHGDPAMCPYGEEDCLEISRNDKSVFPDFVLVKELNGKEIYCRYKINGCKKVVKCGTRREHEQICEYGKVACPNLAYGCTDKANISEIEQHLAQCQFTPKECKQCGHVIANNQIQAHIKNECPKTRVHCPNKCEKKYFLREELEKHVLICPLKPEQCQFARMGCTFKGSVTDVKEHLNDAREQHYHMMTNHCDRLETRMKEMEKKQRETDKIKDSRLTTLEEKCKLLVQKANRQEHRMKETEKVVVEQDDTLQKLQTQVATGRNMRSSSTGHRSLDTSPELQDHSECKRQNQLLSKHIVALEQKLSESTTERRKLDQRLNDVLTKFSVFDLRFQVLETASYNGTLLWKIRDYRRRKSEARSGAALSLYSQPFYTSRHGYRLCARVYLNGDGMGTNTHLSLFFVVMRGDYDPLLKWPFRQRVSLMMLDQTQGTRHIVDTFRPDPSSSSFQRPKDDMNVASGCPLFMSHAILEGSDSQYLVDDTLFIKITVETPDTAF